MAKRGFPLPSVVYGRLPKLAQGSRQRRLLTRDHSAAYLPGAGTPSPLRTSYASFKALLKDQQPEAPVHGLRPHVLRAAASWFIANFPGTAMYAVKCNPDPFVIHNLAAGGIRHFDVASLPEIKLVAENAPEAEMFYMHPVKPRSSIRRAYFDYGVRHFSLDCHEELQKIFDETDGATDLSLHIRLSLPKGEAFHALSEKFGAGEADAVTLLQAARKIAQSLGVCFHVGSQTMTPAPYETALARVKALVAAASVKLDSVDVGGGFPVAYPGLTPTPMNEFMACIKTALANAKLPKDCKVYGEPGRALVSEAGSLLVRVDLRKDGKDGTRALYINDGVYGSLFDSGMFGLIHPTRAHQPSKTGKKKLVEYMLYGPTCDSVDTIKGPYLLPEDMAEGDYIEFGQTGSYTFALQSNFNGFYSDAQVLLADTPQLLTPGYWSEG